MGNRGNIPNYGNFQSGSLKCSDSRFSASPWPTDHDFELSHALIHCPSGGIICCGLSGKGGSFFRTFKTTRSCRSPGNHIPSNIGDSNNCIVEGGLNVSDTTGNIFLLFLGAAFFGWSRHSFSLNSLLNSIAIGKRLFLGWGFFLPSYRYPTTSTSPRISTSSLSSNR